MNKSHKSIKEIGSAVVALVLFVCPSSAIMFESGDTKFGIYGYMDLEYSYMTKMPMPMPMPKGMTGMANDMLMIMEMPETSFLLQRDLNLLFGVEHNKFRANVNMESKNAFEQRLLGVPRTAENVHTGTFRFLEAYGEYNHRDSLRFRAGNFLAPFGIYGQVSYILPLYNTVVLPQIYEPPVQYIPLRTKLNSTTMPGLEQAFNDVNDGKLLPRRALVPDSGNLMMFGKFSGDNAELEYNLYISAGERGPSGIELDRNKGFGGRLKAVLLNERVKIGGSYYTIRNENDLASGVFPKAAAGTAPEGSDRLYGTDVEVDLLQGLGKLNTLTIQGEFVKNDFTTRKDRQSYYVMLVGDIDPFRPYLRYDLFDDKEDLLFKRKQFRVSSGGEFRLGANARYKLEYHYHGFRDKEPFGGMTSAVTDLPTGTAEQHMVRTAFVFYF